MTQVSVIIETVTLRFDHDHGPLADAIGPTIAAVERQTFPRDRFEILLVLDGEAGETTVEELRRRYPAVRLVIGVAPNYFAEKNAGAAAARGAIAAFVDGDCVPDPTWLEALVAPFANGADVVTGRTRYEGSSFSARTFSVPDFGTVAEEQGASSGIMLNNVAFRRELVLGHPLDARIRRNGGCYLLYHQLRAVGVRMAYAAEAIVTHGLDVAGLGFVRKHFDRGYDSVSVYRCDDANVLRGTRVFRRLGVLALPVIIARRVLFDWRHLARKRAQIGITALQVPYYAAVMLTTRAIELCGGVTAAVARRKV